MVDAAKQFLATVKGLTEIQAVPNVFKNADLTEEGRRLTFWAGSGFYHMWISDTGPGGVHVFMTQDGKQFRHWMISPDGVWSESETGQMGEEFQNRRESIAQQLIQVVGSRPAS